MHNKNQGQQVKEDLSSLIAINRFSFVETIHRIDYVDQCNGQVYGRALEKLTEEIIRIHGSESRDVLDRLLTEIDPAWDSKLDDYRAELSF